MIEDKTIGVEIILSKFLRIGVLISSIIILTGLLMFLISGESGYYENLYPCTPLEILKGVSLFKSYAIISLGLLILIAIPILRVGISIIVFFKEKDYLYVKIATIVFVILIISLLLGKVG